MSHPRGITRIIPNIEPKQSLHHTGDLEITGDIGEYAQLTVTGSLTVRGHIHSHASITIKQPTVTGVQELPVSEEIYVNDEAIAFSNNHMTLFCGTIADHVQITADIADVHVMGKMGPGCNIQVDIGSINTQYMDTDSRLQIINGNIHAGYLRGDVNICTSNKGNINVINVNGHATLSTPNGRVHIQSATPDSHITTNQEGSSALFIGNNEIQQNIENELAFAEDQTADLQSFSPKLWRNPPKAPAQIKIEHGEPDKAVSISFAPRHL